MAAYVEWVGVGVVVSCRLVVELLAVLGVVCGCEFHVAVVVGVRVWRVGWLLERRSRRHVAGCQWRV